MTRRDLIFTLIGALLLAAFQFFLMWRDLTTKAARLEAYVAGQEFAQQN